MFEQTITIDDAAEFEAAVALMLGAHRLTVSGRAAGPLAIRHVNLADLSISAVGYGRPAHVDVTAARDHWAIGKVLSGSVRVGASARTTTVNAGQWMAYAPDGDDALLYDASARVQTLSVSGRDLQAARQRWLGPQIDVDDPGLRHGVIDRPPQGLRLDAIAARLWSCAECRLDSPPEFVRLHVDLAMCELAALLWPDSALQRPAPRQSGTAKLVARARDHMQAHLGGTLLQSDLAAALGVGVRWLNVAFERELGMAPARYHRQLRLEQARSALRSSHLSVTEAASAAGFWNLGDFSRLYHRQFGELPGDTRRRVLGRR